MTWADAAPIKTKIVVVVASRRRHGAKAKQAMKTYQKKLNNIFLQVLFKKWLK